MKKSLLLVAFLLAAILAYPQTRRTRGETPDNTQKESNAARESNRSDPKASENRQVQPSRQSENRSAVQPSRQENRTEATPARQRPENRSEAVTPSRQQTENRTEASPSRQRAESGAENRSRESVQPAQAPVRTRTESNQQQSRTRVEGTYENRSSSGNSTRSSSRTNSRTSSNDRGAVKERERSNSSTVEIRKEHPVKSPIVVRETRVVHHNHTYHPIEYRRVHYHYREPVHVNIFWTNHIYRDFISFYPNHHYYIDLHFERGRSIRTISAYDAMYHVGDVVKVYGEVTEVYYSGRDDIWYLYIGAPYPYHDFTVMVQGRDYRRYRFPHLQRLEGAHIWSMGLITEFDGKPEILVKKPYQLGVY